MLHGLFVLLACQLTGEAVRHLLGLPIPGPVIGIVLVVICQAVAERHATARDGSFARIQSAGDGLLRYLGLLFVPAGAGIEQSYDLVLSHGLALGATLVLSTIVTLLATVSAFRAVDRWQAGRRR